MSRVLALAALFACASLVAADLALPGQQQYPQQGIPAAKAPLTTTKGPLPQAVGTVPAGTKAPLTKEPQETKETPLLPAAKGLKKIFPKAAPAPEVTVTCQTVDQNPPFRITTCSVLSKAKTAVCVKLNCNPKPGPACLGGGPPTGVWNPATAKPNQNCSWVLNTDCSSPNPLYPLTNPLIPSGQWGFGFMSPYKGDITVSVASFAPAPSGTCPGAVAVPAPKAQVPLPKPVVTAPLTKSPQAKP